MLTQILQYLADNKALLLAAAATLLELIVLAVNTYRRIKANQTDAQKAPSPRITVDENQPVTVMAEISAPTLARTLLWAANPVNLFRSALIKP
jgi:hypothetical protein